MAVALRKSAQAAIKLKALASLLLFASAAHGATGLVQLPASATHGRVAIVYPSSSAPQAVRRMAHDFSLAENGAPQPGNGRLVVLSHGSGPACEASRLPDDQPGCTLLIDMPNAAHGSILSPPPPTLPPRVARVMDDPPGYDRREIPRAYAAIVQFFNQQLRSAGASNQGQPG